MQMSVGTQVFFVYIVRIIRKVEAYFHHCTHACRIHIAPSSLRGGSACSTTNHLGSIITGENHNNNELQLLRKVNDKDVALKESITLMFRLDADMGP